MDILRRHSRCPCLSHTRVYYQLGAYTLANISADYEFRPGVTLNFTGHNLSDQNYSLTDGYPEQGRTFTVGMKMKF